ARQVGATDRTRKQRVTDEQGRIPLPFLRHRKADAARAVPRRVEHANPIAPEPQPSFVSFDIIKTVDRRLGIDGQADHLSLLLPALVQEVVVLVEPDGDAERLLRACDSRDVIEVRVRQEDVPDRQPLAPGRLEQQVHFVARIDDDSLTRLFAADHETVLVERLDGRAFQHHRSSLSHEPARPGSAPYEAWTPAPWISR